MRSTAIAAALVLSILTAATSTSAQNNPPPSISVDVRPKRPVAGEPFQLTITIEVQSDGEPEIRLPSFGDLQVLRQSESHPSSFSISFGTGQAFQKRASQQSIYRFVLVANKPGKHIIPPVTVKLDNNQYRGEAYTLNVSPSGSGARAAPNPSSGGLTPMTPGQDDTVAPTDPAPEPTDVEIDGAVFDKNFFIQTDVSKKSTVVGEMIIMTVYLYTASYLRDVEVVREPGTEGFWVENLLPGNRRLTTEPVQVAGQRFDRAVLRKFAMFPIKPGELTIVPPIVELEIRSGGFFSKRQMVKRTALPVEIQVNPLPEDNRPDGYNPANVGRFRFSATVDHTEVKAGSPITLTMSVKGDGNLRNLVLPSLDEIPGFKAYDPESEVEVRAQGGSISGVHRNQILLIPREAGDYKIPSIEWTFYDPKQQQYVTQRSKRRKITVLPAARTTTPGTRPDAQPTTSQRPSQDRLNRQLRSILSRSDLNRDNTEVPLGRPWFLFLFFAAPLGYLAIALGSRTRRRLEQGRIKGRSRRAAGEAIRKITALKKQAEPLSNERFFAEFARITIGFLEDRLEETLAGATSAELRERLITRGMTDQLADEFVSELEACDFARFAASAGSRQEKSASLARLEELVGQAGSIPLAPSGRRRS